MNKTSGPDSHAHDTDEVDELCKRSFVLAIRDALNVVNGKWKLAIVSTLLRGPRGFAEIERQLDGITPRMLTRELRELALNGVLTREDLTAGRAGKYALTPSGQRLEGLIFAMANWGRDHRSPRNEGEPTSR